MAAYDDSYAIADLEKLHPSANYSELRRLLCEKNKKEAKEWREKREKELETSLDRCPTTGRTIEEDIEAKNAQEPQP